MYYSWMERTDDEIGDQLLDQAKAKGLRTAVARPLHLLSAQSLSAASAAANARDAGRWQACGPLLDVVALARVEFTSELALEAKLREHFLAFDATGRAPSAAIEVTGEAVAPPATASSNDVL